jgi:hypothetical protein
VATDTVSFDLQDLTIEEIELIEDTLDIAFDDLFKKGAKKGRLMRAVAFIAKRREDPAFTWEQAGSLRIEFEQGSDPTEAGAP